MTREKGEGTVGEAQLGPVKQPTMGKSLEEVKATLDAADVNGLPSTKRPTRKRKSNIIGEDDSTSMTSTATSTAESDASFIPPTGRVVGRKRKRGRKRLGRPPKSKSQGAQQEFPDGAVSASTNHVAPTSSPLVISQPPTLQQKNPILTLNLIPSAPNVQIGVSSGKQFTVPLLLNQRAPASVGTRGSSQLDRMVYTHPLVGVMGQLPVRPQAGQRSQLAAAASPQNTSQVKPIPSPNAKASPQPRAGATASPAGRQQSQPSAASAHVGTHRNSNVRFATAQNGISYPVTPPKTPENSAGSQSGASPGVVAVAPLPVVQRRFSPQLGSDKDFIPLCCCKLNGASFANLSQVMYCQALDSIDGKVIGCCNKVSNPLLVRPAVKIPFMAVCEVHRKRLRIHQCCPGCGHFCTQGKFYQCKKEGGSAIHLFHRQCQFFKDGKYYCPHCGEESLQFEVNLKIHEPRLVSSFFWKEEDNNKKPSSPRAKMSAQLPLSEKSEDTEDEKPSVSLKLDSWEKEISTEKMPLGPARDQLENVLTAMGADKNKKLRCTPKNLYLPSRQGELEKVIYLLSEGFDPDYKFEDHNNQTALHAACTSGYLTIVHVLVAAGASLHITDNGLRTPLMEAVENNNMDVIKYLISCGAKLDWKAEDGMTCLHLAAKEGHIEVMKYLLDTGKIDVNVCQDEGGWTPIIWAAEHKHVDAVRFLVLHGADPNIKDNEENTGLHWAAYSGSCDIAELFINAGCNLESANEHGDRALHIAARQDHYECVVLFLARGADNEARNNENETPISVSTNIDPNSQVHLALKVNKQLKGLASKRLQRPERLLHRDISMGREQNPIPVVNQADEEDYPKDFLYIIENIETYPLNINRVITSLQHCNCTDNCSSQFCVCGRNSIKCWYDKAGRLSMEFNKLEPPLIFECNRACACWNTCNNRVVQNGITCRLQVFKTKGRGWGVKTLLDIPQGTFICEYIGELISDSEADNREDDSYLFDLDNKDGDTYCIDARKYANVARFINHLCEPNLIPVKVYVDHQDLRFPRICFFSSRDIKAQEELGFDYGEKFWIIKWKQFTCACGSPKCKYSRETIHQTIADYNRRVQEEEAAQQAE